MNTADLGGAPQVGGGALPLLLEVPDQRGPDPPFEWDAWLQAEQNGDEPPRHLLKDGKYTVHRLTASEPATNKALQERELLGGFWLLSRPPRP